LYTIGELIDLKLIKKVVTKDELKSYSSKWAATRNYNKMSKGLFQGLMVMFFNKLVEKLLSSDRILLKSILNYEETHEMYITDVQDSHKRFLNLHTGGKVYATKVIGFPNINVKFSGKCRKELQQRLEAGQNFY